MKLSHPTQKRLYSFIGISAFFALTIIFHEMILKVSVNTSPRIGPQIALFSLALGAAFGIPITLIAKRTHRIITGITLLSLMGVIYTLETALYRSLGYFYPLGTVFGMGGAVIGSYKGTVLSTVVAVIPYALLYQLPTALFYPVSNRIIPNNTPNKRFTAVITLLVLAILLNKSAVWVTNRSPDLSYLYNEGYDFSETAKSLGLGTAIKIDCMRALNGTSSHGIISNDTGTIEYSDKWLDSSKYNVDEDIDDFLKTQTLPEGILEINSFVASRAPTEKNDKSGIFHGKNLIFICAEALSPYAISAELTPTLFRIASEGYNFSNYYAPTFGESTLGGEYSLLLSQIPKRTSGEKGLSMQLISKNTLSYSLPAFFRSEGYLCNGYHNNSYTYYTRNVTHPALGLNWYGCGGCVTVDGEAEKLDLSHSLTPGWPRSDRELVEATARKYIEASKNSGSPFFTYYLTVSGHNNYSFVGNKISAKNRSYTESSKHSETVKAYLSAQKELDLALESLLNILAEEEVLDNTVIIIANDHHPYGLSSTWAGNNNTDYLSELYGKRLYGKTDTERGFFTVYCHGHSAEEITAPISSLDVLPTVANLFGIKYDSRLLCGKDAFAPGERLVFFSDGSYITDTEIYEKRRASTSFNAESRERIKEQIHAIIQFSLSVRKNDYYSYL